MYRAARLAALLAATVGLLLAPSGAHAAWYSTAEATNASLAVDSTAKVARNGLSVNWSTRISCPRGEAYTLDLTLYERDPAAIPELAGEDDGIRAYGTKTGTCTGRTQTIKSTLTVVATTWYDSTGTYREEIVPMSPSRSTSAQAILSTTNSFALYCSAPNCASDTGPRVRLT